jgi:hypothetical protein
LQKPPIGMSTRTSLGGLSARLSMSPGSTQKALEMPGRIYAIAAVEMGQRPLAVAWGRLVFTAHDVANAASSATFWTMDLETISYELLPTQDCVVRITLKDGRTLAGEAVLESTNGRHYHFESRGQWDGIDEGEAASDARLQSQSPIPAGSPSQADAGPVFEVRSH